MIEAWGGQPVINNLGGVTYTASSWSTNTFTPASCGGNFNLFCISFFGNYNNGNGTGLTPIVDITIRDNTTSALLYDSGSIYSWAVASGYSNTLKFELMIVLPVPPSGGNYSIVVRDNESDGGTHTWSNVYICPNITRFS